MMSNRTKRLHSLLRSCRRQGRLWVQLVFILVLAYTGALAASREEVNVGADHYGVLIMAHGGSEPWNKAVLDAVEPLHERYPTEVAFGMADAVSLQEGVQRLESEGVRRIGVVRLFVSGESWYHRTQQILGIKPGAPAASHHQKQRVNQAQSGSWVHEGHAQSEHTHGAHRMEFFRIETQSSFALSRKGLSEVQQMGTILAERAVHLSRDPRHESILILAHGPADDEENERWLDGIDSLADRVRTRADFHKVKVMTLREDWPDKRIAAEQRIRDFVQESNQEGTAIVIPFRVYGFGPYTQVLEGLDYVSDGRGLLPHLYVSQWLCQQAESLRAGPFQEPLEP